MIGAEIEIRKVEEVTPGLADQLFPILKQLAHSLKRDGFDDWLQKVVAFPQESLIIAQEGNKILGMLVMASYPHLEGFNRTWIEDVVVDEVARGRGIGKLLMIHAINQAKGDGDTQINLTSRASRVAANELYQGLGFQKIDTNFYRLAL